MQFIPGDSFNAKIFPKFFKKIFISLLLIFCAKRGRKEEEKRKKRGRI
jgi:hypothetical protein